MFLLLLFCTACHTPTREAKRMVRRAELLADTLPDSTARLIDSVLRMPVHFSERERMDMALLQAEALFGCRDVSRNVSKNTHDDTLGDVSGNVSTLSPLMDDDFFDDHATISTSPELERAAAYFAQKKQYAKAAHAALYSGFVQQHYNEKEAAMRSFKEAEQYGGLVNDSLSVAQAEYWMGKMLYYDGMEQEALNSLLISESFIRNRYADRAFIENSKAVLYILMNQYDCAEICLQKGLVWADKAHFEKAQRKILNNYAVLCRLEEKYDHAIAYLTQMVNLADNEETNLFLYYLNMGKTFASAKEMDSAELYFKHVETLLYSKEIMLESKVSAYDALSQFAEERGDIQNALKLKEQREDFLAKVLVQRQEQAVYRVQHQYDYESLQNVMNKKIIRKHNVILIISVLLLITTIIIVILQYRHKQLLELEKEMKRQMDALKQDLRQTVKSSVVDNEISSRLRTILLANRTLKRTNAPQKEWQSLVSQIMNGGQEPFEAARNVLETVYPCLYSTILESYPDLTETEAKICLLSCSELSNKEIAEFLGLRPNTVNQNRSNLRKKLDLKPDRMKEQLHAALFE